MESLSPDFRLFANHTRQAQTLINLRDHPEAVLLTTVSVRDNQDYIGKTAHFYIARPKEAGGYDIQRSVVQVARVGHELQIAGDIELSSSNEVIHVGSAQEAFDCLKEREASLHSEGKELACLYLKQIDPENNVPHVHYAMTEEGRSVLKPGAPEHNSPAL